MVSLLYICIYITVAMSGYTIGIIKTFQWGSRNKNGIYTTWIQNRMCNITCSSLYWHLRNLWTKRARTMVLPLQKLLFHNGLHRLKHIFSSNSTGQTPSLLIILLEITLFKVRQSTTYCIENECYEEYTTK